MAVTIIWPNDLHISLSLFPCWRWEKISNCHRFFRLFNHGKEFLGKNQKPFSLDFVYVGMKQLISVKKNYWKLGRFFCRILINEMDRKIFHMEKKPHLVITKVIEFYNVNWYQWLDLICRRCTCRMWRTPSSPPPSPSPWSTSCRCPWWRSLPLTWPRPTSMLLSTSGSWPSIYVMPSLSKRRLVWRRQTWRDAHFLELWTMKNLCRKNKNP